MTEAEYWQQLLLDAITDPQWQPHADFPEHALAVYRNNYRVGLMEMLAIVYPVVRQLVGEDFFTALAREFVRATPSHSGNLHRYGQTFADFILHFPHTAGLPYLPDVARMEWGLHHGYYASDSTPFDIGSLTTIPQAQWGELRLPLDAALSLLISPWALSAIHAFHQPGGAAAPVTLAQPENLLLWRQAGEMQLQTLSDSQACWLQQLQAGHTLDEATTAALAIAADFDLQSLLLQGLQAGWFGVPKGTTS